MKAAQLLANIPEALPADYAEALTSLQSEAPPMGAGFVRRRMSSELGPHWREKFAAFDLHPAAAASLGQVHRARTLDGADVACKLQYPDMASAVEADLAQLEWALALHRRHGSGHRRHARRPAKSPSACARSWIISARRSTPGFTSACWRTRADMRVPGVHEALSTGRLLTLDWLDGEKVLALVGAPEDERNTVARAIFAAWWAPFAHFGDDPRRSPSRQLRRVSATAARRPGSICSITAASGFSRRLSSAAWSSFIAACATGDRDQIAQAYRNLGLSRPEPTI